MLKMIIFTIIRIVEIAILIDVLASWIPNAKDTMIIKITDSIAGPLLNPARDLYFRLFPNMMIDFSPILVLFILDFIRMGFSTL
ncbi:YGGT family protein [Clostridium collagenovorans DSM 3089]|uniref:YGGT family protein n=1 Tax=Clostridium collagenovorans DSM 3089 TaxID=1121306 RepID=A0A1M5T1E6_9CLOT|nr:YggT family protein [Clostridium collagenovorans]SHH44486.1 YGGT family protein [Clostridium collagenovorans DSM 3089]